MRFGGKLYRRALETSDYTLARRKLAEFRCALERTDASKGKTSLAKMLDAYEATLTGAAATLDLAFISHVETKAALRGVIGIRPINGVNAKMG